LIPKVSVVIPCYNQAGYLGGCLASVVRQTVAEWEAIVVDDKSTEPDLAGIVAGFQDPRIRLLVHERNRGLAAARNSGIRSSRAEWFVPLDADDELEPDYLETLLREAEAHPDCEAVFTDFLWFGAFRGVMKYRVQQLGELLARRKMPGPGVLTRRRVWERVGGYCEEEVLRISCEDHEFWVSALEGGLKAHHVARPLYRYRKHPQSVTARGHPDYYRAREFIYRRHQELYDSHGATGRYLADGYWKSAYYREAAGDGAGAARLAVRATLTGQQPEDFERLRRFVESAAQSCGGLQTEVEKLPRSRKLCPQHAWLSV